MDALRGDETAAGSMQVIRMRSPGPTAAGRAEERARRAMGVAAGVGGVLWLFTHRRTIAAQADLIAAWWTPLVVTLVSVAGSALIAVAVLLGGRAVGTAAAMLAVVVPAGIATLPLAGEFGCFGPAGTWMPPLVAVSAMAGVLVWPRGWPINLVLTGAVAVAVDFYVTGGAGIHSVAESLARTWVMQGFFACITAGILRAAVQLDAATAATVRQAAVAASAEATDRERSRFAGLIHDNVLATLRDAARGGRDTLVPAATRTLHQLDDSSHDDDEKVAVPAAVETLRGAALEAGGGITVDTRIGTHATELPGDVVSALGAAVGEAARNSVRHSAVGGREVVRTALVAIDDTGATVRIRDDGAGFDPGRVAGDRLGIRSSIIARMRRVPGGDAVIESQPGRGTVVTLRWLRTAAAEAHLPTLISVRGGSGIAMLVMLELAVTMLMVGYLSGRADPHAAIAGYGLVGVAGAAVLIARHDPLPLPATAFAILSGPAAVLAIRIHPPDHFVHHGSWILVAYSYVLALLAIRGRIAAAWIGLATAAAVFAATGAGTAAAIDGAAVTTGTVLAASGFALYMRPMLRSFHLARAEVARHAGAEARIAAQDRERRRQLSYLDRTARPMLESIASGEPPDDARRQECALLEAQLRDRLRAPCFDTPGMVDATRRARRRGVAVTLLDDGGLDAASDEVRNRALATSTAALDATTDGRITVRALPPGRPLLVTVVSDQPLRIEIGPDGTPTPQHTTHI
ncbi:sensor histidine kinase [Nocardia mexicana]|uniref:Signal transduction histidine kinase n=1 Tax=Nocardia mexicana TaxID=279262 RepID=A0A370H078_9NOCA|nr:ATP-binding protein [Nocardia mexicana]RDI48943.1 signal transduction histidine kinase [Nocardia mexicana]